MKKTEKENVIPDHRKDMIFTVKDLIKIIYPIIIKYILSFELYQKVMWYFQSTIMVLKSLGDLIIL